MRDRSPDDAPLAAENTNERMADRPQIDANDFDGTTLALDDTATADTGATPIDDV